MAIKKEYKVLLVEDNEGDARLIQEMLRDDAINQFSLTQTKSLAEAVQALETQSYDVVLLDLNLPDSTGESTFSHINSVYSEVPIVILTGNDDQRAAFSAIGLGAQDYLVKGTFQDGLLSRAILYAIERKRLQNMISHLSLHDALTGLPNRRLLMEHLARDVELAKREQDHLALLMLDLDNFKDINDEYGHHIGDIVLVEVAHRLQYLLRKCDLIARIGGDEFVVPIPSLTDPIQAEIIAGKIIDAFQEPIMIDKTRYQVSFCIGIAIFPDHCADPKQLIKLGDQAMYKAKADGKGTVRVHQKQEP